MEFGENWSYVIKFSCSSDKSSEGILNELQFVDVFLCYTIQEGITVVKFSTDDAAGNCTKDLRWETGTYMTYGTEMEVGCSADRVNVLTEAELRIKGDTKTLECG